MKHNPDTEFEGANPVDDPRAPADLVTKADPIGDVVRSEVERYQWKCTADLLDLGNATTSTIPFSGPSPDFVAMTALLSDFEEWTRAQIYQAMAFGAAPADREGILAHIANCIPGRSHFLYGGETGGSRRTEWPRDAFRMQNWM